MTQTEIISGIPTLPSAAQVAAKRSFRGRLLRRPRAQVGLIMVSIVILMALLAPVLAPNDPLRQFRDGLSPMGTPLPPDERFVLGTDHLGRDMWSRVLYGAQVSLVISLLANLTAATIGTSLGLFSGYFGGTIDYVVMRTVDVLLAFPAILLALGIGAVLRPSIPVVVLILTIIATPTLARLVRSQTLSVRERLFVESARAVGASDAYIIFYHILPHVITVAVVWVTLGFATTVLIESSLSFLGVGVPAPTPSWGNMIADGQSRYRIAPWMIIVPTAAILITTLGFNLLGDAVRDALDPRTSLEK
jgi:peptide/nickel transport system permease protein